MKSPLARLYAIQDEATRKISALIEAEARNVLRRYPGRYSRFSDIVGDAYFYNRSNRIVWEEDLLPAARKVIELTQSWPGCSGVDIRSIED